VNIHKENETNRTKDTGRKVDVHIRILTGNNEKLTSQKIMKMNSEYIRGFQSSVQ
jgi:hypothetical protein